MRIALLSRPTRVGRRTLAALAVPAALAAQGPADPGAARDADAGRADSAATADSSGEAAVRQGRAAVRRMQAATVLVQCANGDGMGSGVAVGSARIIVTNHHVLAACEAGTPGALVGVRSASGGNAPARVVATDARLDIAVLSVEGSIDATPVQLASDADVVAGQMVWALGYPGLAQSGGSADVVARVTVGPVSREAQLQDGRYILDHSAGIYPGNSGGPLFDGCGKVVGINTMIAADEGRGVGTIGFAVGARTVADLLGRAGQSTAVAGGTCRTSMGAFVGQAAAAGADAAALKKLEASYARSSARWEKRWRALQTQLDQRDSTLLKQAGEQVTALAGVLDMVHKDVNGKLGGLATTTGSIRKDLLGVTERTTTLEQSLDVMEKEFRKEQLLQWVGIGGGLLAAGIGIVLALGARKKAGAAQATATQASTQVAAVRDDLAELERRLAELERQKAASIGGRLSALDARDSRSATDARAAIDILDAMPGMTVGRMSSAARTRVARTRVASMDVGDGARPTHDADDEASVTGTVELTVRDLAGERRFTLAPGATAYVGRDADTLRTVAERFVVEPVLVAIAQRDGENVVSRAHCTITNDGDVLRIVDLSTNGTVVVSPSGARIVRGTALGPADRRDRPDLVEKGDMAELRGDAQLALVKADSGYDLLLRRVGAPAAAGARGGAARTERL